MNKNKKNPAKKPYNEAVFFHENGEVKKAIAAYTKVLQTFGGSTDPDVQETAAMALVNKAACLNDIGDSNGAIASWDEMKRRFGKVSHPPVRRQVAMSMVNKACYLWGNDRLTEAVAICDEVIAKYGEDEQVAKPVADCSYNKGVWFGMAGRLDESIEASSLVIQKFGASPDPAIQTTVDHALSNKLVSLKKLEHTGRVKEATDLRDKLYDLELDDKKQREQALKICQKIVKEFSGQAHPVIRSHVVAAVFHTFLAMQEEGNAKGAIQACQLLVQKFGNDDEPLIRERVAMVLIWTAGMHREREEYEAAISAYGQIGELFGNDKFPTNVRKAVIEAEQSKISLLNELEQYERGINACNTILQRHPENPADPRLNAHIRWVMAEKGAQLLESRKFEEAIAVFDEVERRFTFEKDADSRQSLALLLRNKTGCLRALGRHEEALIAQGLLLLTFGNDPEPSVRWHAQNLLYFSDDEDEDGEPTALIDAAGEGPHELVRPLIDNGNGIDEKIPYGPANTQELSAAFFEAMQKQIELFTSDGTSLEFTRDGLLEIDQAFQADMLIWSNADEKEAGHLQSLYVMGYASLLGEVLCRNFGGQWREVDGMASVCIGGDESAYGDIIRPFVIFRRRFDYGESQPLTVIYDRIQSGSQIWSDWWGEPNYSFIYGEAQASDLAKKHSWWDNQRHDVGELFLPSGQIVACDPLVPGNQPKIAVRVPPGRYTVTLLHDDGDVNCAFVRFSEAEAIRWAFAAPTKTTRRIRGELEAKQQKSSESEFQMLFPFVFWNQCSYPVDSGMGCFMDAHAWRLATSSHLDLLGMVEEHDESEEPGALVEIDTSSGLNIAAFHIPAGDRQYPSFVGYDQHDNVCVLVTDFLEHRFVSIVEEADEIEKAENQLSDDEDDSDDEQDLIGAAGLGRLEVVRQLLDDGANIEAKNPWDETALMHATVAGHIEIVRLLLERGAKVDPEDDDGDTSLMKAAYNNRLEVAQLLLEHGADINHRDDAGDTALIWAAWQNHPQVVRLLLERGAKVGTMNTEGKTAFSLAGSKEIRQLLRNGS